MMITYRSISGIQPHEPETFFDSGRRRKGMSSRLPESYAQKNRFFNCRDQLCVNLDTGELIPVKK